MDTPPPSPLFSTSNLEYIGHDPHHGQVPRFNKTPNQWFYDCFNFVVQTLYLYAFTLGPQAIYRLVHEWRRSHADETKAEEFFMRYDVDYHDIIKDQFYWTALDIVTEWFRPKWKIHPVHFTDLRWYPWKLSTNVERPFSIDPHLKRSLQIAKEWNLLENARVSFHNLYNEVFRVCRKYIHDIKDGRFPRLDPITLHVKPALVKDSIDKVRTVFGVPKYLIFSEAMFFWPLFSHYFTEQTSPLLWNYETLQGGWHRLNDEWNARYRQYHPVFNLDWSEFDMRVYFSMWKDCRSATKSYFCFCGQYCPTRSYPKPQTNPKRLENLWNWIEHAYFNMTCSTTTGKLYKRLFAGMPSGIFCTQFWDSFYNAVMVVTILLALGYTVNHDHFVKLMGDDVLFGLLEMLPIDQWADFLERFSAEAKLRFNSKLSAVKCGASSQIHGATVLSYTNWNGYPTRDPEQLLAQLLHPKSLKDTFPRLMARAVGIYYASAGNPRIRVITEHIFSELKHKGFTPHRKTVEEILNPLNLPFEEIPLDHFPSRDEVISRLSSPSRRNPQLQHQYWNLEHFVLPAGQAWH